MPVRIAAESTEFVRVPVTVTRNGASVDPTTDVVQLAVFPSTQDEPLDTDWRNGSWETDTSQTPPAYYARVLIGPGATPALTLTDGTWQVWVKVYDSPEVVVRNAGRIIIY